MINYNNNLNTPLAADVYTDFYDDAQPDPLTIFGGRLKSGFETRRRRMYVDGAPYLEDYNPQQRPDDGTNGGGSMSAPGLMEDTGPRPYGSPFDYLSGNPTSSTVPVLLALQSTDKTGTVAREYPLDATFLNNPATEGLLTLNMPGSPLVNNMQDRPGYISGADSVTNIPMADEPDTTETDDTNAIDTGIPGLHLKKSVLKETGVFVVGALILIVGIFALTR